MVAFFPAALAKHVKGFLGKRICKQLAAQGAKATFCTRCKACLIFRPTTWHYPNVSLWQTRVVKGSNTMWRNTCALPLIIDSAGKVCTFALLVLLLLPSPLSVSTYCLCFLCAAILCMLAIGPCCKHAINLQTSCYLCVYVPCKAKYQSAPGYGNCFINDQSHQIALIWISS